MKDYDNCEEDLDVVDVIDRFPFWEEEAV